MALPGATRRSVGVREAYPSDQKPTGCKSIFVMIDVYCTTVFDVIAASVSLLAGPVADASSRVFATRSPVISLGNDLNRAATEYFRRSSAEVSFSRSEKPGAFGRRRRDGQ